MRQTEMILSATPGKPVLIESRLASILLSRLRAETPERQINSVSILLVASEDERKRRALRRTLDDKGRRIEEIAKELDDLTKNQADSVLIQGAKRRLTAAKQRFSSLDIDKMWAEEQEREEGDQDWYREIYPWFRDYPRDYMDPEIVDQDGKPVYNIVIGTDGHTPEEVYDMTCRAIIEFRQNREDIRTIIGAVGKSQKLYVVGRVPNDKPR